jgi:phenylacetate-coenzyme A ligase PaaK-like adenylate-forming protein
MKSFSPLRTTDAANFDGRALKIFHHQATTNKVYAEFISHLGIAPDQVMKLSDIPFLPIQLFKSHQVLSGEQDVEMVFKSSGTTGSEPSLHYVTDLPLYEESFIGAFEHFYGSVSDYTVLALLPSYLEREGSSLVYMVSTLIERSGHYESGFYLDDLETLNRILLQLDAENRNVLLLGVSFALLDLIERYQYQLKNTIVMETGGMKGRRDELVRQELHQKLCAGFGLDVIHSEYGMTELLSHAYSQGNGVFNCPPWMRVYARDTEDAMTILPAGRSGGLNIIDLANVNSCSFIATQDLGKVDENGSFEVLGRFDHSDIRGCNLMVI